MKEKLKKINKRRKRNSAMMKKGKWSWGKIINKNNIRKAVKKKSEKNLDWIMKKEKKKVGGKKGKIYRKEKMGKWRELKWNKKRNGKEK